MRSCMWRTKMWLQCTKPECPKPKCELVCENPNCKPKVACCGCDGAALG
jgi:hypothetical protein